MTVFGKPACLQYVVRTQSKYIHNSCLQLWYNNISFPVVSVSVDNIGYRLPAQSRA